MKNCKIIVSILLLLAMLVPTALAYEELTKGSKGEPVVALQTRLNELNYDAGVADGIYGNGTAAAVSEFQKKNHLEATGIADAETQEVLFSDDAIATVVYEPLDWKGVSRNPDDFEGRYVKFDGKVLQVINGYTVSGKNDRGFFINTYTYGLRVATKGNYDDVVFILAWSYDIEGGGRIIEGDRITVSGQYDGICDYTTVLGAGKSIPQIDADSIKIK